MMRLRKDFKGRDEGFTLIELMVVVLIIAILIAIAIPTFLGARRRAQNRAAQSNLRNALTAEKTYYVDAQQYADATVDLNGDGTTELQAIENSLVWIDNSAVNATNCFTGRREVCVVVQDVVSTGDLAAVNLGTAAASGNNYNLGDEAVSGGSGAGTWYACNDGSSDLDISPLPGQVGGTASQDQTAGWNCT
mgnify:CR=1 FL=1